MSVFSLAKVWPSLVAGVSAFVDVISKSLRPWQRYSQDGLYFQLDQNKGLGTDGSWANLMGTGGGSSDTLTSNHFDGTGVYTLTYPDAMPESVKVEIYRKADSDDEAESVYQDSLPTSIGDGFTGYIYAVRVYDASLYTDDVQTKNAARDNARFNVPSSALWLGSDDTIMLGEDYLCLE